MAKIDKHITAPDHRGYQVRIVRDKKEHSRYFSHKIYGSKKKSLKAAQTWRNEMIDQLPIHTGLRDKPLYTKYSCDVVGVSASIHHDKRRDHYTFEYQVRYRNRNDTVSNRKFIVGHCGEYSKEEETHAFKTACAFREEYVICCKSAQPFHHEKYRGWKHKTLY